MRCIKAKRLISKKLDGEISEFQMRELEIHLSECIKCQEYSDQYEKVENALKSWCTTTYTQVSFSLLKERIQKDNLANDINNINNRKIPIWATALGCASIIMGVIFGTFLDNNKNQNDFNKLTENQVLVALDVGSFGDFVSASMNTEISSDSTYIGGD